MIKKMYSHFVILAVSLFCLAPAAFSQDHELLKKVEGTWMGTLKVQGIELTLVFNFTLSDRDSLTVTIDSPDQGAKDIPTSSVVVTKDSMIVKSQKLRGTYRAVIKPDYTVCAGQWKQAGMSFPLELVHSEKKFTRNRPQEPQPPFPYRETDVVFTNPSGGHSLAGTLTLPNEKGSYPAAILISGSGPQNRNEELLGHKPFLVLADYLTRQGIAVLRYDDRGIGKSTGDFQTATSADFASDVSAAIDFLKTREEIDTLHIGLIGHSEGGLIAPMVAAERKDVGFVVLLAGPGLTGEQILLLQSVLIAKAENASDEEVVRAKKLNGDIYTILRKNSDNTKAAEKIRKVVRAYNKKYPPAKGEEQMGEKETEIQIQTLTSPWFRYFLTSNPANYLVKVQCPLLALNGSLDLQVPPKENLNVIEKAMIFGGNSHYTIEEVPGVNHLFQTTTNGAPSEYSKIEETISPLVLERISGWIIQNTR